MAKVTPFQASFAGGELSPYLWGRYDLDQYSQGCAELINYAALPYGPIVRRCGTRFVDDIPLQTGYKLIKFVYSSDQAMVLLMIPGKIYFYYDLGIVMVGDAPLVVDTTYTATDLLNISYTQMGDIIWLCCGTKKPKKLMRYGWTNWILQDETFINAPPTWAGTNWPKKVCFYDQRLIYAGTPSERLGIWCSRIGIYNDFTKETVVEDDTEVMDTDAIWYTLASDESNEICWILPLEVLAIGTAGAEFKVQPSALNETITPNNFKVSRQTAYGSLDSPAAALGDGAIFIQRANSRIRLYSYEAMSDSWEAKNATVFSDHICNVGAVKLLTQNVKDTYCWVLLKDGSLATFTYEKGQKISAWHRHKLTDGIIRDMVLIPGGGVGDESDQLWLLVERVVEGTSYCYMEVFAPAFGREPADDLVYLDSFMEYDGPATSVLHGITHLAGKKVRVTIGGADVGYLTVGVNGTLNLPYAGSHIKLGLNYTSRFTSLDINSVDQNTMGKKKRVVKLDLFLYYSLGLRVGTVSQNDTDFTDTTTEEIYFGPTDIMNRKPDVFTGVKEVLVSGNTSDDVKVVLETSYPYPSIIRDIRYTLEVN